MNKKRVADILKRIERLFKGDAEFSSVEYLEENHEEYIFRLSLFTGEERSLKNDFGIINEWDTYDVTFEYDIAIDRNVKLRDITDEFIKKAMYEYEDFIFN